MRTVEETYFLDVVNKSFNLSHYISLDELNKIIDEYKEIIEFKIKK